MWLLCRQLQHIINLGCHDVSTCNTVRWGMPQTWSMCFFCRLHMNEANLWHCNFWGSQKWVPVLLDNLLSRCTQAGKTNMTMENSNHFEDASPIKDGDFPASMTPVITSIGQGSILFIISSPFIDIFCQAMAKVFTRQLWAWAALDLVVPVWNRQVFFLFSEFLRARF